MKEAKTRRNREFISKNKKFKMKSPFSYWSSTACVAKKTNGGTCASVNECIVNVGLECTGGMCQCSST